MSCPICTLRPHRGIFKGEGCTVSIYKKHENKYRFVHNFSLFLSATIHGFNEFPCALNSLKKVLAFGEKSFCIFEVNLLDGNCSYISQEFSLNDWIISGTCSKDGKNFALATSHSSFLYFSSNEILKFSNYKGEIEPNETLKKINLLKESLQSKQFKEVKNKSNPNLIFNFPEELVLYSNSSTQNSLLYSGLIIGSYLENFILIGGTAFGNANFWIPYDSAIPFLNIPVAKGAIFSISFNSINNLLSITSDDRSIKLYKFKFENNFPYTINQDHLLNNEQEQDQNIHLEDLELLSNLKDCKIEKVFSVFGHGARVWKSLILNDKTVLSCGEDSNICHWDETGNLLNTWYCHCSSIWSLAVNEGKLYAGGTDGSIKVFKIYNPLTKTVIRGLDETLIKESKIGQTVCEGENTVLKPNFPKSSQLPKNTLRCINQLNTTTICICNNSGQFWIYNSILKTWKLTFFHNLAKGYSITAFNSRLNCIAVGTLAGKVLILNVVSWKETLLEVCNEKIQSLIWIENELFICSNTGNIFVYLALVDTEKRQFLINRKHVIKHKCKQPWFNCAAVFSSGIKLHGNASEISQKYLVVGCPSGDLHLFTEKDISSVFSISKLHKDGVTCIKVCQTFNYNEKTVNIVTLGRNGIVNELKFENNKLLVTSSLKFPHCNWLCEIFQLDKNLIVCGFSSNKVQLWNINGNSMITEIDCGGGHRAWNLCISQEKLSASNPENSDSCKFTEISNSGELQNIILTNKTYLNFTYLKDGKPVSCKINFYDSQLPNVKKGSIGSVILCAESFSFGDKLFFGAEDTLLYIFSNDEKFSKLNSMKSHLSGVKCISKIKTTCGAKNIKNDEYILTAGGRAQFKVWKISNNSFSANKSDSKKNLVESKNCTKSFLKANNLSEAESYLHFRKSYFIEEKKNIPVSEQNFNKNLLQEIFSHRLMPEFSGWRKGVSHTCEESETRFMDSEAYWIDENFALFIFASSDALIRFFRYDLKSGKVFLIKAIDCEFCLLRLCVCDRFLVASNTRGSVFVWDLEAILKNLKEDLQDNPIISENIFKPCKKNITNCALNSLSCFSVKSSIDCGKYSLFNSEKLSFNFEIIRSAANNSPKLENKNAEKSSVIKSFAKPENYLAAGGDDGGVYLLKFHQSFEEKLSAIFSVTKCSENFRHVSQVSGLHWIDKCHLLSAAKDQRIFIWQRVDENLIPISVYFTSIPDVQGIKFMPEVLKSYDYEYSQGSLDDRAKIVYRNDDRDNSVYSNDDRDKSIDRNADRDKSVDRSISGCNDCTENLSVSEAYENVNEIVDVSNEQLSIDNASSSKNCFKIIHSSPNKNNSESINASSSKLNFKEINASPSKNSSDVIYVSSNSLEVEKTLKNQIDKKALNDIVSDSETFETAADKQNICGKLIVYGSGIEVFKIVQEN